MKHKHTSGPWKVGKPVEDDAGFEYIPIESKSGAVGGVPAYPAFSRPAQNIAPDNPANARLMAKAPEMLDFIAKLVSIWEQSPDREIHREEVWGKNDLTILEQARGLLAQITQ
ncbi:MAG: hypothetical protein V3W44_08430 [Dehalococcoidales bacterium]